VVVVEGGKKPARRDARVVDLRRRTRTWRAWLRIVGVRSMRVTVTRKATMVRLRWMGWVGK
jgi:hypothetical protein